MSPFILLTLALLTSQGSARDGTGSSTPRVEREAWAMGTRFELVVEAGSRGQAVRASEAALLEVERLERILSSWDAASEMSRVNAAPAGSWVSVSPELASLLGEAAAWSDRTGRSFDPSIGALVDAWNLRGAGAVPDSVRVVAALRAAGERAIEVRNGLVIRRSADAWIDAGGFGKGAALRSAATVLERGGVTRALLDLGGQLWAAAPADEPWIVRVAHPLHRSEPVAVLAVADVSVATSGFSERPGHLLDPRTGRPVPSWGSVTVVGPDAMEADVLATALYVMGPEVGLAWALERPGLAALFLQTGDGAPVATWTPAMEEWLIRPPDPQAASGVTKSNTERERTDQ